MLMSERSTNTIENDGMALSSRVLDSRWLGVSFHLIDSQVLLKNGDDMERGVTSKSVILSNIFSDSEVLGNFLSFTETESLHLKKE